MAQVDPEQERARLVELYAHKTDEELGDIAAHGYELTEQSRSALGAELARRGLSFPVLEYLPGNEVESRPMVAIRRFRDLPEALLAKGSLESAGINSALVDDNIVRLDWFLSNLLGGIKLLVDAENASAAEDVLAQPIPEHFEVAGVGQFEQPCCPKCGSLDVNFREAAPAAYVSTMLLNLPLPLFRRAWRCRSCQAEWEDDGAPVKPASPGA